MNFLRMKTTWSNAEFIVLKLAIASAYLIIGAFFHEFVLDHYIIILLLFSVTVIWSLWLWLNKLKKDD